MSAPDRTLLGCTVGGKFRIDARIGSGAVGEVFAGTDLRTARRVAIKVLFPRLAQDVRAVARFRREAEAVGRIVHDGVVDVLDYGDDDGVCFLVMSLLGGRSLAQILAREGALGVEDALDLVRQCCEVLRVVHAHGIVHRDLKPQNLFVEKGGDSPCCIKVLDFGVAKLLGDGPEALTRTGEILGTLAYMAPEQVDARDVDPRADVYSLGVVFYQTLTGRLPFYDPSPTRLFRKIMTGAPPALDGIHVQEGVLVKLREVVHTALSREPSGRYRGMEEFSRALERVRDELRS